VPAAQVDCFTVYLQLLTMTAKRERLFFSTKFCEQWLYCCVNCDSFVEKHKLLVYDHFCYVIIDIYWKDWLFNCKAQVQPDSRFCNCYKLAANFGWCLV